MILSLIVPQTLVLVFNNISDGHCCNIIIVLVTLVPRTKIRKVVGPIILFPTVSFLYLCESQGCIYIQFSLSVNLLTKIPCSVSFPGLSVFDPLHFIIASSTDGSCLGIYIYVDWNFGRKNPKEFDCWNSVSRKWSFWVTIKVKKCHYLLKPSHRKSFKDQIRNQSTNILSRVALFVPSKLLI